MGRNRACKASLVTGLALSPLLLAGQAVTVQAQDFYAGKTISIIVSGGGAFDTYARTFSRHMPRHIPGQPNMIVQGMPGGGGVRAASFIYKIAPKDGTSIGGVHGAMLGAPLLTPSAADYDITKFGWIGNATRDQYVSYFWHTSPVQSMEDLKTKKVIVGGSSVGGAGIDLAIIGKELFGLNLTIVSGYKTSQETKLAIEKGEVYGTMANGLSSLKQTDWLETGKVRIVMQHGSKPNPELGNVPMFRSLARNETELQILDLIGVREEISKPYIAPPGLPAERLNLLRRAFDATLKDPKFIEEMKKQRLELTDPMTGEEMEAEVRRIAAIPAEVGQRVVKMFEKYNDSK